MTTEVQQKPKLQQAMEDLNEVMQQLNSVALAYQEAKRAHEVIQSGGEAQLTDAGLTLSLGAAQIPMPMPTGAERASLVESAIQRLGQEVVRLWNSAHQITTSAKEHCDAAAAQAQAAQATTPAS